MEKKIRLISILLIMIFCCVTYKEISYASFADYTDDDAKQNAEKMINEQQQNFDASKSNNNFLKSLEVKGYELTPEFDKQTLEYYIDLPINIKEITIEASTDDDNAKMEGIGVIQINENQTDYRIDVTAESGTVRTYLIKINSSNIKEESDSEVEQQVETSEVLEAYNASKDNINEIEENSNTEKMSLKNIIIIAILVIIVIMIITKLRDKPKARRRK